MLRSQHQTLDHALATREVVLSCGTLDSIIQHPSRLEMLGMATYCVAMQLFECLRVLTNRNRILAAI